MLTNKVVVVTGGAGFLGKTFCRCIAAQNGIAVISDNNIEAARNVADSVNDEYKGRAIAHSLDITEVESIQNLLVLLKKEYGHVDAVVNNAYPRNKNYGKKLEEVTYESFCENSNLHLGGYFLVAQQFSIYFKNQGYGNIINMSSIYGSIAPRFDVYDGTTMTMPVEYAAIKSGIEHLTRYFAQYYKKNNIRVNSLSPGGILDQQPKAFLDRYKSLCGTKGMLNPEDVCGSLLYLLSDYSRHVTGQNLVVDDGFSL